MNKTYLVSGIVIILVILGAGLWLSFRFQSTPVPDTGIGSTLPVYPSQPSTVSTQQPGSGQVAPVQIPPGNDPAVSKDFLNQTNITNLDLYGTVVVSTYAIQNWGNGESAGEALLTYATSTGWSLVTLGGGKTTADDLVYWGVPKNVADELVAGLEDAPPSN